MKFDVWTRGNQRVKHDSGLKCGQFMGMFPQDGLVKGRKEPLINKMRLSLHMGPSFFPRIPDIQMYTHISWMLSG